MKKKKRKLIYWITTVIMIIAMIPLVVVPVLANATVTGVKYEIVDLTGGMYKLVFSAKSIDKITLLNTIFSFDNTLIQPVSRINSADIIPVTGVVTDVGYKNAFKTVAVDANSSTLGETCEGWIVDGTRTAFNWTVTTVVSLGVPSTTPLQYVESNGVYKPMFEFYFRLLGGTVSNISTSTFKFEDGKDAGGFVGKYNPAGDTAGIRINGAGEAMYWWGSINPSITDHSGPGNIDKVINQFNPVKVGDTDGNGIVNAADLSILLGTFNKSGINITNPDADIDDNGIVNAADLSLLLANFNK